MIRFIKIGSQIIEGENQFAFYDTVVDSFIEFGGNHVFDSIKDFTECFRSTNPGESIDRFTRLINL